MVKDLKENFQKTEGKGLVKRTKRYFFLTIVPEQIHLKGNGGTWGSY